MQAAGIAGERTVGTQHAVAGHDDAERVAADRGAHGEADDQQWIDSFHTGFVLVSLKNLIECLKSTSEWSAADIRAAWDIAERHHLHKPVVEQPQYHLFHRKRVEQEYARLYDDIGLGLTTWSPLASGLLTGKYRHGIPAGSRASLESMAWLRENVQDKAKNDAVGKLSEIAAELGGDTAQLAIAWANRNPRVSSVILGASRLGQLQHNLGALALTPKLTPEVVERIDALTRPLSQ